MTAEIRRIEEKDASALFQLYPHWGLERCEKRIRKTLSSKRQFRLVAEMDGRVVGQICVKLGSMHHSHLATFYSLIVDPGSRGKGIASRLVEEAIKALPPGIEILKIQIQHDNNPSLVLFEKLGFKEYGRLPRAFKRAGEYKDNVLLKKEI